jgi:hypothetical protein
LFICIKYVGFTWKIALLTATRRDCWAGALRSQVLLDWWRDVSKKLNYTILPGDLFPSKMDNSSDSDSR